VASGALRIYLYERILALFSAVPYTPPIVDTLEDQETRSDLDLAPHLTNTALQTHRGEEGVRLLDELIGCRIYSVTSDDGDKTVRLTEGDIADIKDQITEILAETFKAAQAMPIHFQVRI
jgi:tubulin---tyrosine ligase